MHTLTEREVRTEPIDWTALLTADADFLRPLVEAAVQATLEAEMAEALGVARASGRRRGWTTARDMKPALGPASDRIRGAVR